MNIERYSPSDALKPFIKTLMIVESVNEMESRILPDTSIILAFRICGKVTQRNEQNKIVLPSAMISGLRNQARVVDYSKNTSMLLVAFRANGARAFFSEPLHEIFGVSLPLDDIWRRSRIVETEEKLSEAATNGERIRVIESFLLSQLKNHRFDRLVFDAIEQIKIERGSVKISALLKLLHTSRDPFEKRFRRTTGTSPKQFAQIVRLRSLINQYSPATGFADLAANFGYFDQAHLTKDFKSFTGQTPQTFFKSSRHW